MPLLGKEQKRKGKSRKGKKKGKKKEQEEKQEEKKWKKTEYTCTTRGKRMSEENGIFCAEVWHQRFMFGIKAQNY